MAWIFVLIYVYLKDKYNHNDWPGDANESNAGNLVP